MQVVNKWEYLTPEPNQNIFILLFFINSKEYVKRLGNLFPKKRKLEPVWTFLAPESKINIIMKLSGSRKNIISMSTKIVQFLGT